MIQELYDTGMPTQNLKTHTHIHKHNTHKHTQNTHTHTHTQSCNLTFGDALVFSSF